MRYFCSVFTTFFPDPILKPARGHLSSTHSSTVAFGSPYLRKLPCVSGCTRLVGSQPLVLKPSVNLCFQTTLPLQQQVPMINVCYFCKCVFNATGHLHKLFAHFVNSRLSGWNRKKGLVLQGCALRGHLEPVLERRDEQKHHRSLRAAWLLACPLLTKKDFDI